MFKQTAVTSMCILALAGCSSMSGEDIATLDRSELSQKLSEQCETVGAEYTPVSIVVDTASQTMVSIQERQCTVFKDYSTLATKHGDVSGFLAFNADKTDEELLAAIEEFDADKSEDKKIRPQIEAYKQASESIFDSNVKLAGDIAIQVGKIGLIATDNAEELMYETGMALFNNALSAMTSSDDDEEKTPIVAAYDELMFRSSLVNNANDLITLDQTTIKQLENLDKILDEQVK